MGETFDRALSSDEIKAMAEPGKALSEPSPTFAINGNHPLAKGLGAVGGNIEWIPEAERYGLNF